MRRGSEPERMQPTAARRPDFHVTGNSIPLQRDCNGIVLGRAAESRRKRRVTTKPANSLTGTGGHVLPERLESDLPKAIESMRKVGLAPLLMTTAVEELAMVARAHKVDVEDFSTLNRYRKIIQIL